MSKCPNCGQVMYNEQIACSCGWNVGMPNKPLSEFTEDEKDFLRRQFNREYAKLKRDPTRQRAFGPKKYKQTNCEKPTGEKK